MITNGILNFAKSIKLNASARDFEPWRIVLHYTAGTTLSGAKNTLNKRGLGYHVLIDVDGTPYQSRPFTKTVAHAGRSNWKAAGGIANGSSLNGDAIGICFVNLGQLAHFHNEKWYYERTGNKFIPPSVADADATKAALIYTPRRVTHWTPYQPEQLTTCERILGELVAEYHIEEIVGHHDIAIDEKPDPGPLCPLEEFRKQFKKQGILGLKSIVKSADGALNLRDRPSSVGQLLATLHNGDEVHIRAVTYTSPSRGLIPASHGRTLTAWASVDVDGSNKHAGFVHMAHLTKTPLAPEYQARLG